MADKVYPDVEAPRTAAPPPGTYYNAKDQQIPPPATYQERRRGRSPCCCFLKWFCIIHLILLFLVGLFVLIFWLIVMPKTPHFDLMKLDITGLTGASSDTDFISTLDYKLMVHNPNKHMDFYYSDISFQVQASGTVVGKDNISDFSQGHKNTTDIDAEKTYNVVILSSDALTSITEDESNVALYAEVDLKVKYKVWGIKSRNIKSKVKCNVNVDLTVTSESQLIDSDCKFHW